MSDSKKEARSSIAVLGRAVEMGTTCRESTFSTFQSITPPPVRQIHISDFLGCGQAAAVPLRHLKELAHRPGREVRRLIQAERLRGVPILSDNSNGYYLAANDRERDEFVKSMKHRAREIVKVAEAIQRAGD